MIKTFTDNNKRLEKYLYDAKTLRRENLATGKFKSVDFQSNGSLRATQSSIILPKSRPDRADELSRRQLYVPVKVSNLYNSNKYSSFLHFFINVN